MRFSTFSVCAALCVLLACGAFVQGQKRKDPCQSGITSDLVDCSLKELAKADAELNKVYKQLMSLIGKDESEATWKVKLKAAQQAWIKYRDANCEYEAEYSGGGSAYTFEYNFCLAGMTTARAQVLQKMIDQIKARDGQ